MTDDKILAVLKSAPIGQDAVHGWFHRLVEQHGFRLWVLSPVDGPGADDCRVTGNYPQEYMDRWVEQEYSDVDPIWKIGPTAIEPFRWSDLPGWRPTTARSRKFLNDVHEYGLVDGLTVPFQRVAGGHARVNLAGFDGTREELGIFIQRTAPLIKVAATILDLATNEMATVWSTPYRLTKRQIEVLHWAMLGKIIRDTAEIIGLSVAGVRWHINEAKANLGAINTSQAIAKAIKAGLLKP